LNGRKTPAVFDRDPHLATWFHEGPYGIYETADHRYIAISLNALDLLDKALGPSDLSSEKDIDAYVERDRIAADVVRRLSVLTLSEAEEAMNRHKVWHAPVKNYSDLANDPQALHNQIFRRAQVDGREAILVNHPNRYDGDAPGLRHIAERPGQDTDSILAQIGFSDAEVTSLKRRGAVA
jgi:crotonobetainyl-CoA:carnitine CoA-transferase CaiB-like acyl-CoA transferase